MFTQWEDAYAYIVHIRIMTSFPGCRTIHRILWLEDFLDSRLQYESLEGLMDFLEFLVQTLWKNKQKIIRGIPTNSLGNPYKIWGLMALTWAPETLGSLSWPLKASYSSLESNQILSQNFGPLWRRWRHKETTKKSLNYPFSNPTHRKPRTQI